MVDLVNPRRELVSTDALIFRSPSASTLRGIVRPVGPFPATGNGASSVMGVRTFPAPKRFSGSRRKAAAISDFLKIGCMESSNEDSTFKAIPIYSNRFFRNYSMKLADGPISYEKINSALLLPELVHPPPLGVSNLKELELPAKRTTPVP